MRLLRKIVSATLGIYILVLKHALDIAILRIITTSNIVKQDTI